MEETKSAMSNVRVPEQLREAIGRYDEIYVVVSPPRCSSTAFARVLWQVPSIGYYSHEPFEVTYYDDASLADVAKKLKDPLDLSELDGNPGRGAALVIKEMPFQVGEQFPILVAIATQPLTFLVRDPRQNIASRMEKKIEAGDSPNFPRIETGWQLLAAQIERCRQIGQPLMIVDSADFRNDPKEVFPQVLNALGLDFTPDLLSWQSHTDVDLDNLGGRHTHLYRRVLESSGVEPADEPMPALDSFPEEGGWREHVEACLEIYEGISAAPERIRVN